MERKKRNLEIVSSAELQSRANIERRTEESVVLFRVVVDGKILGMELQLGIGDIALVVVLEGELDLGEVLEELA